MGSSASRLESSEGKRRAEFRTTHWGIIARSGRQDPEALDVLCWTYWPAVYSYTRRMGYSDDDAKDLTQAFFVKILDGKLVSGAEKERGRFRSFLLTLLKRFAANQARADKAWKRGGRVTFIPWDEFELRGERTLGGCATSPECCYDVTWARTMLESVMQALRTEYQGRGQEELFRVLSPRLSSGGEGLPSYAVIGEDLQLGESAVKMAMKRMRQRFGERLRQSVAATVIDPKAIEDEIRHLLSVLADDAERLRNRSEPR